MAKDWIRREIVNDKYRYYQKYICQYCGKEFEARRDAKHLYCSHDCHSKAITKPDAMKIKSQTYYPHVCELCGKEYISLSMKSRFCSYKCSGIYHRGKNCGTYKTGEYLTDDGYIQKLNADGGYHFVHRKVIEDVIGRKLTREEHIHHINENKLDNRIENLVILTRSEHMKVHRYLLGQGKMTLNDYEAIINRGRQRIDADG